MTPFEAFLAFMVVMGVIAIPLSAIITRPRSPIGEAIAERIRRKTERRLGPRTDQDRSLPNPGEGPGAPSAREIQELEAHRNELMDMETRLEFLERLLEKEETRGSNRED